MDINKKFGGAWWDTLFILIKDDDEDFIMDFIERLPCKICRDNFYHKIKVKRILIVHMVDFKINQVIKCLF